MIYLLIGADEPAKDLQLKALRKELLAKETEQFNFELVHGRDLALKALQEKLLSFPVRSSKRILLIKDALGLKEECQDFLLAYVLKPYKHLVLILESQSSGKAGEFINQLARQAKVFRYAEDRAPDAFLLNRHISARNPTLALRVLSQLLENGEQPMRIMGGLRYAWQKDIQSPVELRKRLKLLLNCDIEIKTGRLKAALSLEKMVLSLCAAVGGLG